MVRAADETEYAVNNIKKLLKLGPSALSSKLKLSTSNGSSFENFDHLYVVSLMYKPLISGLNQKDFYNGFERNRD